MLTRAAGFGVQGRSVDGQDVRAVYAVARDIVEHNKAVQFAIDARFPSLDQVDKDVYA